MAEENSEKKVQDKRVEDPKDAQLESGGESSRERVTSLPPPAWEEGAGRSGVSESPIKIIDESPAELDGGVWKVPEAVAAQGDAPSPTESQRRGFDVIFTGGVLRRLGIDEVKQKLSAVFGIERSRVDKLFANREVVVKTNTDRKTASEYIRACEHAGAVCRMEPHPARLAPVQTQQEPTRATSQAPAPLPRFKPRIISPNLGPSQAMFTPIKCLRLNRPERGLEFMGPLGREERPVEDVLLVAVFENALEPQKELQMLCFVKGIRRPYLINASAIHFKDFPGVLGQGSVASLRNLLRLLFAINPRIILEQGTYDFMQGNSPLELEKDLVVLSTALGTHLEEEPQSEDRDSLILSVQRKG